MPDVPSQDAHVHAAGPRALVAGAEHIAGSATIRRRAAALASSTRTEWLTARPGPHHADPTGPALDLRALCAGVAVKVLYHDTFRDDPDATARARRISAAGGHVRTTSAALPPIAISDRQTAVILVDPADPAAGTIWTRQPAIIVTLAILFDQAWNTATPLATSHARAMQTGVTYELAATDRDLLRLLVGGATDEFAARHLGVSLRTTRRHMAVLMRQLGATSRFQAGAEAARRGLLP